MNIIRLLKYPFGTVKLYEQFAVAQMKEGTIVSEDMFQFMEDIAYKFYGDNHFVYISNRINSYSVDPAVYLKISQIPNLSGIAITSAIPLALSNAKIEGMFTTKPFKTFKNLPSATNWALELITRESNEEKKVMIPTFYSI